MPEISGLILRSFRGESDFAGMAEVLTASQQADGYDRQMSGEEFARGYRALTNCDLARDIFIAEADGQMVGYIRGWWEAESAALYLYKHNAFLRPEWRRKEIGRRMLESIEGRLREVAREHPAEAKKAFQASVSQQQAGAAALLERAGYQAARYFFEMVRPDLEAIPDLALPEGVEVRPAEPEQYRMIWESALEDSKEEWGLPAATEEAYQAWLKDPLFQPELWQIAWEAGTSRPVGHVLTYINQVENHQFKRRRGYTEGVGVSRAWRRQGLARALISRSLQAQKAAGMSESALVADSENAGGVIRLYESCGFQEVKRDTVYRKEIKN